MAVSPEKIKALEERFAALGVREQDIIEKFVRSQGHGGQKLNKTSSCVYLRHVPTGIEVKCQQERSQALNRFLARRLLADKIDQQRSGGKVPEHGRLRKQKLKRAKRARVKGMSKPAETLPEEP
ncbi:MAG TPA: peptide chain release factor-like protein [Deltaproteobacteria bacterium]|nr:peptide chain release factor-like protein [Deltaproteobacteria bacterium]